MIKISAMRKSQKNCLAPALFLSLLTFNSNIKYIIGNTLNYKTWHIVKHFVHIRSLRLSDFSYFVDNNIWSNPIDLIQLTCQNILLFLHIVLTQKIESGTPPPKKIKDHVLNYQILTKLNTKAKHILFEFDCFSTS